MKISKSILLAPLAVLSLGSCSLIRQRYKIEDYVIPYSRSHTAHKINENDSINILQLSDIHMSVMDDADLHYKFIRETLNDANVVLKKEGDNDGVDLIVITGDVFTFSDRSTVKGLCDFFETLNTPWTLVFGNHDEQGYYPIDWLTGYLTEFSKRTDTSLLFSDFPNDDVFGSSNFVIDFGNNRQAIMLDSNRYNYGEGYGYDYIHHDQIDWYLRAYDYFETSAEKASTHARSLAFFHIPVPEFINAYEDAADTSKDNSEFLKSTFHKFKGEAEVDTKEDKRNYRADSSEGAPGVNTGFFETVQKLGYTKGFFVGHAHTNTNCMDYRPKDSAKDDISVGLCFGIKSTDRVYCHDNWLGGQLIKFKSENDFKDKAEADKKKGSNWFDTDVILHEYADLLEEGK